MPTKNRTKIRKTANSKAASKSRPSELRQDLVSLDWVTIATGRAKRPHAFAAVKEFVHDDIASCPFDHLETSGNEEPVLVYGSKKDWTIQVLPNKYPAFTTKNAACPEAISKGPYRLMEGVGYHEVIVLRDHYKQLAELPVASIQELLRAYKERYLALNSKPCVNFTAIFHNHGREAGGTLTHPHSQLIALPIIPPDIRRSLEGSERFFKEQQKCVHCVVLEYELRNKSRVVYENDSMAVITPYASHAAFELRLFPKKHAPRFEDLTDKEERAAADALKAALWKLHKGLNNPSFNYFIHTIPPKGHDYIHYHWHLEIVPKSQIWAGFEISTGIEISAIAPEKAASFLRRIK
jgi:UDPglucose--hexose-1-phosphate uridylyltransferase